MDQNQGLGRILLVLIKNVSDIIWRTKVMKIWLAAENVVRWNILSAKIQNIPYTIKSYQINIKFMLEYNTFSADKSAEISNWCRKFSPPKNLVRWKFCPLKFCPIRYCTKYISNWITPKRFLLKNKHHLATLCEKNAPIIDRLSNQWKIFIRTT